MKKRVSSWKTLVNSFVSGDLPEVYEVEEEQQVELVAAFCSSFFRSQQRINWNALTLGLFVSLPLNRRVFRVVDYTLPSLTLLTLEEVDTDVLLALNAQNSDISNICGTLLLV